MALNESEKLMVGLASASMQAAADGWKSLYEDAQATCDKLRIENERLRIIERRWNAFRRLVAHADIDHDLITFDREHHVAQSED